MDQPKWITRKGGGGKKYKLGGRSNCSYIFFEDNWQYTVPMEDYEFTSPPEKWVDASEAFRVVITDSSKGRILYESEISFSLVLPEGYRWEQKVDGTLRIYKKATEEVN